GDQPRAASGRGLSRSPGQIDPGVDCLRQSQSRQDQLRIGWHRYAAARRRELFKMMTGVVMQHVPYRGSAPALTDLLGGQVQLMIETTPASLEHIRQGRLRALAVTTLMRADALPDLPTVADFVPGYEAISWYGIVAPKSTPPDVVDKLNKEVNAALADPKIKARLADLGGTVLPGSPADFGKLIVEETEKWGKVVK